MKRLAMNRGMLRQGAAVWCNRFLLTLGLMFASAAGAAATELGIKDAQFTLKGKPTFLLGISYYGALGASEDFIRRDLDDMQRYGFNWIRVWATFDLFGHDVSAVDGEGNPREPFLGKLKWLLAECDRRGMAVDVTLARSDGKTGVGPLRTLAAHRRAVETLVTALKPYRNWYLDLGNERNLREFFVNLAEVRSLREGAKRLDPRRLVTASHAPDINRDDLREYLLTVQVDFISPHRTRDPQSPTQTEAKSREYLARMKELGRIAPLHYQEPFRRGFRPGQWEPPTDAFLTDLKQARAGGAAGWCFHNGHQSDKPDGKPRRTFDLRERRLFEQFDEEERKVLAGLKAMLTSAPAARAAEVRSTLRSQADRCGFLVGCAAWESGSKGHEPAYTATLAREFNLVATRAQLCTGVAQPHRGNYQFGEADQVFEFVRQHREEWLS
jgi:hypothetical protein